MTREDTQIHSLSWVHQHVFFFRKEMHLVLISFPLGGWLRQKLPGRSWHAEKTHWIALLSLVTHRKAIIKHHVLEVMNENESTDKC